MLENRAAEESGLTPHILRQIAEEIGDRDIAALAVELTGWLDEDGYLRESDDEICATLGVDSELLHETVKQICNFTPPVFLRAILPIVCGCNCRRQVIGHRPIRLCSTISIFWDAVIWRLLPSDDM